MELLNGLLLEYDGVVANINSQRSAIVPKVILTLFLNQEIKLQQSIFNPHPSAQLANK